MDVLAQNLIFGEPFVELAGLMKGINERTGDTIELMFTPSTSNNPPSVFGECKDKNGYIHFTISGNHLEEIFVSSEGQTWSAWKLPGPRKSEEMNANYNFYEFSRNLNNLTKEMVGVIAPTDSRFRTDLQLFENGKI